MRPACLLQVYYYDNLAECWVRGMKEDANQEVRLLLLPTQGAKKVNLTANFSDSYSRSLGLERQILKRLRGKGQICLVPDKHYYSLDDPSHDTVQMLTSQAHHNLAPCWGFVSTILNHTSDNEKAC